MFQINLFSEPLAYSPSAASAKNLFYFFYGEFNVPLGTHTGRDALKNRVHQIFKFRADFLFDKGGCCQAYAAVNIITDTTRRDDARFPVKGGNAANGESVPPVHIRHGQRRLHNARKGRHIGHLLERFILL